MIEYVKVFIIGSKLPAIVSYCIKKNRDICKSNGIDFIVEDYPYDSSFSCAGKQAEYLKICDMSEKENQIVIDWDVEIKSFSGFRGEVTLVGFWNKICNPADGFIVYNKNKNLFIDIKKLMIKNNEMEYLHYFFNQRFFNRIEKLDDECYHHYNTNMGLNDVKTVDFLSPESMENYDISCKNRNGDKWPVL